MTKLYEDIRSDKSKTISIVIYYTSITLTLLTLILQIYLILISDYQIQARQILENIDREKLSSLVYNTPSIESYLNDEPILIQQIYGIQSDSKKENQDYENLN